eukprot:355715-Chlamydomonas_euryale.AAC.2
MVRCAVGVGDPAGVGAAHRGKRSKRRDCRQGSREAVPRGHPRVGKQREHVRPVQRQAHGHRSNVENLQAEGGNPVWSGPGWFGVVLAGLEWSWLVWSGPG